MYLEPLLQILDWQNPAPRGGNHTVYDRARGVFSTQPNTTLVLLIDVKTAPQKTWELVMAQLEPLREKQYLTRYQTVHISPGFIEKKFMWPGPVIVVGTGNMDSDAYLAYIGTLDDPTRPEYNPHSEYHDYFFDAPLEVLPSVNTFARGPGWTSARRQYYGKNSYYASVSFAKAIGSVRTGFSKSQLATVRNQIYIAKMSGLTAGY